MVNEGVCMAKVGGSTFSTFGTVETNYVVNMWTSQQADVNKRLLRHMYNSTYSHPDTHPERSTPPQLP
jgi:hypothetical protein